MGVACFTVEVGQAADEQGIQEVLYELTRWRSVPCVFVKQQLIGGWEETLQAHKEGKLHALLEINKGTPVMNTYDYDLIILGGGSGGLAAAKEAAKYEKKVMVLDFVSPTPRGNRWGLGGTCVNVGCIPKKLMHQATLLGKALNDACIFGWEIKQQVHHNWNSLRDCIQEYIASLNWNYGVSLRENSITYMNAYGEFVGSHKIKAKDSKGKETFYTAEVFIISTGERPMYLGIPGDKEYCITSDDLFSFPYCPGKTLIVGASYVALECAGILAGLGLEVTVMVRSVLLRGFDQQMANKIGDHMEESGIKFIRHFVPTKVGSVLQKEHLNLRCDYENVPTTIFTPLEYGTCGLSEERAIEKYGERDIEVYHSHFFPLEWTLTSKDKNKCYAKIICRIKDNYRVIGFHLFGPNAGEITQGFAAAMKCGITKEQLDSTIGIHPVCAEIFINLTATKRSGADIRVSGC
nr:PREDICTED: thioredoxin reductase 1, cytoplasmic [Latimeria chalumnae]|eukprot:XP_014348831.1 PREDICTED: thioredoxin reductase 1, cytoplasmic [Latimeria chalumnae]